jgi:hypothetical protein
MGEDCAPQPLGGGKDITSALEVTPQNVVGDGDQVTEAQPRIRRQVAERALGRGDPKAREEHEIVGTERQLVAQHALGPWCPASGGHVELALAHYGHRKRQAVQRRSRRVAEGGVGCHDRSVRAAAILECLRRQKAAYPVERAVEARVPEARPADAAASGCVHAEGGPEGRQRLWAMGHPHIVADAPPSCRSYPQGEDESRRSATTWRGSSFLVAI